MTEQSCPEPIEDMHYFRGDIKKDNVGSKLVTAAQLGTIDVFSEDTVGQILEVLDKRFNEINLH